MNICARFIIVKVTTFFYKPTK